MLTVNTGTSLFQVIDKAIKAVPAVRFALGVGGVTAVVALIAGFHIDYKIAAVGTVGMIVMMFLLLVFARAVDLASAYFIMPTLFVTWAIIILIFLAGSLTLSSYFFKWPRPIAELIPGPGAESLIQLATNAANPLASSTRLASAAVADRLQATPTAIVSASPKTLNVPNSVTKDINSDNSTSANGNQPISSQINDLVAPPTFSENTATPFASVGFCPCLASNTNGPGAGVLHPPGSYVEITNTCSDSVTSEIVRNHQWPSPPTPTPTLGRDFGLLILPAHKRARIDISGVFSAGVLNISCPLPLTAENRGSASRTGTVP